MNEIAHEGRVPLRRPRDYPTWVCLSCAYAAGKGLRHPMYTYTMTTCDICGEAREVLPPRDFGGFTGDDLERMRRAAQQRTTEQRMESATRQGGG